MNDYFSAIIFLIIIAFFVGLIFWLFSRAKEKFRFEKSLDYVLYEILLPRREEERALKKTPSCRLKPIKNLNPIPWKSLPPLSQNSRNKERERLCKLF